MNKASFPILLSLCLIVFFTACKGGSETNAETNDSAAQEQTENKSVASQLEMIPIELNNGAKWKADALTTLGIGDIKVSLDDLDVSARGEEYQILTNNLIGTIKQTLNSSEMEGEAKTQFTNYIRNMAQITDFIQSSDTFVRQEATEELRKMLDAYDDYFE